jgi:hypothetical protein
MINLRSHDLHALPDELKNKGVGIIGGPLDEEYKNMENRPG